MLFSMQKTLLVLGLVALLLPAGAFCARIKTEFTVVQDSEPQTLDPGLARTDAEKRIALALFEGLVVHDNKTTAARPGLAESWTVSKDGLTYTFKLRRTTWSDGARITAGAVVDSWFRTLEHPGVSGDALAELIVGAQEFRSGKQGREAVQLRAPDDATVVVKTSRRLPSASAFADLAFAVVPPQTGNQWGDAGTVPPTFVGNGPYKLASWKPQDEIILVPNPRYWDPKSVRLTRLTFLVREAGLGYKLYKKGEVDWLPDLPAGLMNQTARRRDFHNDASLGTYFYRLNVTDPTLADVKVRRALALALDRAALAAKVAPGLPVPAFSMCPPFPDYLPPKFSPKENPVLARKLLSEAGFPGGKDFPNLIILTNTGEANRRIAEAVQDQWKTNLDIDVVVKSEDWSTYQEDVTSLNYQIARSAWIGGNDPLTFLELAVSDGPDNNTGFSDSHYDELVAQARSLPSGPSRTKVLKELETLLMAQLPILPLFHYAKQNLIDSTKWNGWYGNLLDVHPWKNLGPKIAVSPGH